MTKTTVILVVEDEAIIRKGGVQMLEDAGFEVVEADNSYRCSWPGSGFEDVIGANSIFRDKSL